MIPACSKLLFQIFVYREAPEAFHRKWGDRQTKFLQANSGGSDRLLDSYRSGNPPWDYSNIAGFFDLYWDTGTRFLADSYFEADRRRRYGKAVQETEYWPLERGYHRCHWGRALSEFWAHSTMEQKRGSLQQALLEVRSAASRLGAYADISTQMRLLDCLDIDKLLSRE